MKTFEEGPTPTADKLACAHVFAVRMKLREMERRCRAAEALLEDAATHVEPNDHVFYAEISAHLLAANEMDR